MPPKKKYVLSTTVRWSAFEVNLFRYLATLTSRTMADEMRTAIRAYARTLPEFDPEAFMSFVKKQGLPEMDKGPERDQLRMESEAFAQHASADSARRGLDRVGGTTTKRTVKGSAADFELDHRL